MDHGRSSMNESDGGAWEPVQEEDTDSTAILSSTKMMDDDLEGSFFDDLTVLCSERLSQMTKTYDDLEAVTQLLEEKEKDLELAAKIGKSLLERNKELQQTNEYLEEQLNFATDQVTQLKHELQQKIDLLHIYTDNESAIDSGGSTPANERLTNWGLLQRKIRILEEENVALKLETNHLRTLTQGLEEKEQQLLTDCMKQIADSNGQIENLSVDIVEKQEQCESQQKQLNRLLKEMVDKSASEKMMRCENEELSVKLRAAQETQSELAQELLDLQERYAEVIAMLTESREEMKQMKEKASTSRFGGSSTADDSFYDSLASELEASDSGYSGGGRQRYLSAENQAKNEALKRQSQDKLIKVMETVRSSLQKQESDEAAKRKVMSSSIPPLVISSPTDVAGSGVSPSIGSDQELSPRTAVVKARGIVKEIEVELSPTGQRLSRAPSNESLCSYPAPGIGVPGIPGTKDLEFAIRRLSLRRRVELEFARYRNEKGLTPAPSMATTSSLRPSTSMLHCQSAPRSLKHSTSYAPPAPPPAPHMDTTPKSTRRQSSVPVPIRSRLMLVKAVEGSDALAHWKELATPGGIDASALEKRPGIKVRGGAGGSPPNVASISTNNVASTSATHDHLESELESTSGSSDYYFSSSCGGRHHHATPGTFTFVNSQIMHPRDDTITTAAAASCVHSASISAASSISGSPPRGDDGTSTFSTALNLAQALGERCVDLVAGIGGGRGWWPARQSPMTVPVWSAKSLPRVSTVEASRTTAAAAGSSGEQTAKSDVISGLGTLIEEDGPIVGLDQVRAVEKSPERRRSGAVEGVVTRAAMKR